MASGLPWPTDTDSDGTPLTGTPHNDAWLQSIRIALQGAINRVEVIALSASDVALSANGLSGAVLFIEDKTVAGNLAIATYRNASTPAIVFQTGTAIFVVAAPGLGEIQIKDLGAQVGIRAGATRNGDDVRAILLYLSF